MKFALALAGTALLSSMAYAADAGEVLAMTDRAMSASEDLYIKYDVLNQEPGKKEPKKNGVYDESTRREVPNGVS